MNDMLKMVLANPADDIAKLAYADWLEENGQTEQSAFIRQYPWDEADFNRRTKEGRRLYNYVRNSLGDSIPRSWKVHVVDYPSFGVWKNERDFGWSFYGIDVVVGVQYGFISAIAASSKRLVKTLPKVVKIQPINYVVIANMHYELAHYEVNSRIAQRRNRQRNQGGLFNFDDADAFLSYKEVVVTLRGMAIPQPIFNKLSSIPEPCRYDDVGCVYPNAKEARNDLGRAYLEWAREQP